MKRILMMIIMMLTMLMSVNAVSFITDSTIENEFKNNDVSFQHSFIIFGSDNNQYTFNNVTFTYDFREDIDALNDNTYLIYNNNQGVQTIQVLITPVSDNVTTTTYNVTLSDGNGVYYFRLSPDVTDEKFRIEFNAPDGYAGVLRLAVTETPFIQNTQSITATFVNSMKDLIDINLSFWRLAFYLSIITIIFGAIALLIGFAFKVYDWAEDLSYKKKKVINAEIGGSRNRNNNRED